MRRFFTRARWDRERAHEIEAHLAHHIDDLVGQGLTPEQARQQALRDFGNPTRIREEIYEQNSLPVIETLVRDLRYAARVLAKAPGFTITAILTLGLAIGINTAVFSSVDGVLLRPLPYPEPDRLSLLEARIEASGKRDARTSQNGFAWVTVRDHATTVDRAVFSTWVSGANIVAGNRPTHAQQQKIGTGFFGVLGVTPLYGREFTADEDRPGGRAAVILSQHYWRASFGGDPSVIGRTVSVRGEPHTVVGIMPTSVQTGVTTDLWTPLRASTTGEGAGENYQVLLRRRAGVSQAEVDAELTRLGSEINRLAPAEGATITYGTTPLQQGLTAALRRPLMILWGAVVTVLVIACVNLAGLLLARGARRSREIATRLALGSGRTAIVRQLLVESAVLAGCGTVLGLMIAALMVDGLKVVARDALDLWQPVTLDRRAVMAATLLAAAATALFGTIPAWFSTRVSASLAPGTRTIAGASSFVARRVLLVAQVALGVVLLVAAGLLLRTFAHLRGLEPGFDGSAVVAATVSLQDSRYATSAHARTLVDGVLERLRTSGRIESAAVSLGLPYQRLLNLSFRYMDGPEAIGEATRMTSATYVAGDYFGTLRIPVRAGRVFDGRDTERSQPVAIVNTTIAREYFGGADPIGRHIRIAGAVREIVGVVGDVQLRPGFGDRGPLAAMPLTYVPLAQVNDGFLRLVHGWFSTAFLVRARDGARADAGTLRAAMDSVDPLLPFAEVRSMADVQRAALAMPRLLMTLLLALAAAAVALTAVGLYSLIASAVTERTREMGIRLALGASARRAIATVALPGVLLALAGIALGALASRGATTLIQSFVWGVSATDPVTYATVAILIITIAIVASVLPALRILRIDPARVLRQE